jgi:hypothetical protein
MHIHCCPCTVCSFLLETSLHGGAYDTYKAVFIHYFNIYNYQGQQEHLFLLSLTEDMGLGESREIM